MQEKGFKGILKDAQVVAFSMKRPVLGNVRSEDPVESHLVYSRGSVSSRFLSDGVRVELRRGSISFPERCDASVRVSRTDGKLRRRLGILRRNPTTPMTTGSRTTNKLSYEKPISRCALCSLTIIEAVISSESQCYTLFEIEVDANLMKRSDLRRYSLKKQRYLETWQTFSIPSLSFEITAIFFNFLVHSVDGNYQRWNFHSTRSPVIREFNLSVASRPLAKALTVFRPFNYNSVIYRMIPGENRIPSLVGSEKIFGGSDDN